MYEFSKFCLAYYWYNLILFSENFFIIYYYLLPKIKKKFVKAGIYLIVKKFQVKKLNFIFFCYTGEFKQSNNINSNYKKNKFLILKNMYLLILKKKLKYYFWNKIFKSTFELIFKLNSYIKRLYFYLELKSSYKVLKFLDQYLFHFCWK